MALVKCPDCGKMVSSRVEVCPFCGCPAQYFDEEKQNSKPETEDKSDNKKESNQNQLSKDTRKEDPEKEYDKICFNFNGMDVTLPTDIKDIARELGPFMVRAQKAADAIDKMYQEAKSLENVISLYYELANGHIFAAVDEAVRILYSYQIYMSTGDFLNKYQNAYALDVVPLSKNIYNQYKEIMSVQEEMKEYRAAQKAGRTRWEGGGFGFSGAIKGAAKAAALNAASGALHAPLDIGRKASDNAKINNALDEIYKNPQTKNQLINITYGAVKNVYLALYSELCDQGKFEVWQNINPKKAADLYHSITKYEKDENKKLAAYVACLNLDPTNSTYHAKVYLAMLEGNNNFEEWIHFWGLEPCISNFAERKASLKKFKAYLVDRGMGEFDFTLGDIDNLVKLRRTIYDYWKETGEGIPEFGSSANLVKAYFQTATKDGRNLGESKLIKWIPEDITFDEFMKVIQQDIRYYQMSFLSNILDYKGKDGGVKAKKKIMAEGSDIILYDNISFLGNGDKGYAMTNTHFWDIKNNTKIALGDLENIGVLIKDKKTVIYISDGQQNIYWNDDSSNCFDRKYERYEYVSNLMEVICERYGDTIPYINDTDRIPCPNCGKLIIQGTKFCNYCGESTEEKKVCTNCGRQIPLTAKFCNYCGEKFEAQSTLIAIDENKPVESDDIELYIIKNFLPNNKVKAIKYYREQTGTDLKTAKEKIDNLLESMN